MSRPLRSTLAALLVLLLAIGTWVIYSMSEGHRFSGARRVLTSKSEIRLRLDVLHDKGPFTEETYALDDRDGVSSASYKVAGRRGTSITVEMKPYETYDVSFTFGKMVQDGLWDLRSKPVRGDASARYTVNVFQAIEGKSGGHVFSFTDPHYWSTAREFQIHLERGKPLPDLLVLQANARDKRYEEIVADFRTFGTAAFREQVARAQARAGAM